MTTSVCIYIHSVYHNEYRSDHLGCPDFAQKQSIFPS